MSTTVGPVQAPRARGLRGAHGRVCSAGIRSVGSRGHVSATGLRRGRDGKLYPAAPPTREQRNRVRNLAHCLVHRDGLSIRAAQWVMADSHGLKRSVGIIMRDLTDYVCPSCTDVDT